LANLGTLAPSGDFKLSLKIMRKVTFFVNLPSYLK